MADNKITRICSIDGCGRKHEARGLCSKHYAKWRSDERPDAVLCSILTCQRNAMSYGKCAYHRRRELNNPVHEWGHGVTFAERFWSRVALTADDSRCWEWQTTSKQVNDYGRTTMDGKHKLAHHVAWFLTYGELPTNPLLHSCDNPPCVNPRHLREGTKKDNTLDCMLRGRHSNVLSSTVVRRIRILVTKGHTASEIAALEGITWQQARNIQTGRTYRWLT